MNYRVECLTPLLAGDGSSLSPIDYMVWKDQVNVLDQRRIFRLLARGPRLDGYLNQVRKAEKLDFASWGGFAQNFAGRRIPFEHSGAAAHWERQRAEHCHIPSFARTHTGPFLPGSALRGALRTAFIASRMDEKLLAGLQEAIGGAEGRPLRHPGDALEQRAMANEGGRGGWDPLKALAISDSAPSPAAALKIYLVRVGSLAAARGPAGSFTLVWKQARGPDLDARRADDATPSFVEMAAPGSVFEGSWTERGFYRRGEVRHVLHWKDIPLRKALLEAANAYAGLLLDEHQRFAAWTGLPALQQTVAALREILAGTAATGDSCLLSVGWGAGLASKVPRPAGEEEPFRRILASQAVWARAVRTGMPFPKTRRLVFLQGQAASLPGWIRLRVL